MDKNKKKRIVGIGVIAAIAVAVAASGSGVIVQNAEGDGGVTVAASAVTSSINYQGRLTDSTGEPLSGAHEMTFKLYEVDSGGTALDTDTHSVTVTDGLFNTDISFKQSYFDGRELWLGINEGADAEMMPRHEFKPVPYALSLVPGANIIGSVPVALHAESTQTSGRGIRGYATADSGTNFGVLGASKSPYGCGGYFYNDGGGTGVYGKGKYGGYFTTDRGGTWDARTAGVKVSTAHKNSDGVRAYTEGDRSDGVYARTYGYRSYGVYARTDGDGSDGVYARTDGDGSEGVYARTYGDDSEGVYARTSGDNSEGVYALTYGDDSEGVYALTYGDNSNGVHASSKKGFGVYAVSHSLDCAGVYAKGKGDGADIILGGSDGKIQSDPTDTLSDINLIASRDIRIDLENDGDGGDADFSIYDKDDDCIFNVDESGDVSYGGPNIAAFPRPAYDSGWVSISQGTTKTLTHNLGGNPDNYVVDLQFYRSSLGRHQLNYGGDRRSRTSIYGAYWNDLDDTRIEVYRYSDDTNAERVRVRIWVYK